MDRKLFLRIILLLIIAFCFPVGDTFAQQDTKERIIITFKETLDEALLQQEALEVHHRFPAYHAAAVTVTKEAGQRLRQHEAVESVEVDAEVTTSAQTVDWGYQKVDVGKTHQLGVTGKGVKIGILDTGVYKNHPDLNIAGGVSFVGPAASYGDVIGHGTHVAGIIGARNNDIGVLGVAPDAEIYAIKIIDNTGFGNHSDVVQGIEWAMKNKLDLINLSITTPHRSSIMEAAMQNAYDNGLLIIAAAGNSLIGFKEPVDVLYPARFPAVVAVGAVTKENKRAGFSYYGQSLEFVAPGESVLSTYIPNPKNELYVRDSGTSMAAPYVTGIAALYKEAYPGLDNKQIRTLLQTNVRDLGAPGRDSQFGYGLIQSPKQFQKITFPDLPPGAWSEQAITTLYEAKMLSGYPDGKFYPNQEITRAEAVTMISRTLSIEGTPQPTPFKDVAEKHYASGYINRASERGIINGYPDGNFGPSDPITRADTAVMVAQAFDFTKISTTSFEDVNENKYYADAIRRLKELNIASGFPDGTYQPEKKMTRAEFAVLIAKALEEFKNGSRN